MCSFCRTDVLSQHSLRANPAALPALIQQALTVALTCGDAGLGQVGQVYYRTFAYAYMGSSVVDLPYLPWIALGSSRPKPTGARVPRPISGV